MIEHSRVTPGSEGRSVAGRAEPTPLLSWIQATAFVIAITILASACGGKTPTTPTPVVPQLAQVAGTWSGTFEATVGSFQQYAITLALTQAGSGVNGTWVIQSVGWTGNVTGTVDTANFSGSLTFNATATTGAACTGSGSFAGPAGGQTMTWSSAAITGNCTGMPTGIRMVIQRR